MFFYVPGYDAHQLVLLYGLLYLLQSNVLVVVCQRKVRTASRLYILSGPEIKVFLSVSVVTLITNSIQFLAYRMDYWFIEYYRGVKELGWYSLSVRLVQVFWVLPALFAAILFPVVAKEGSRYNDEQMLSFTRLLFFFNLVAGIHDFTHKLVTHGCAMIETFFMFVINMEVGTANSAEVHFYNNIVVRLELRIGTIFKPDCVFTMKCYCFHN